MPILNEQQEKAMIGLVADLANRLDEVTQRAEMYRGLYNDLRLASDALMAKKEDANEF